MPTALELLEAIKSMGAAGGLVFGILYLLERNDRKQDVSTLLEDLKTERTSNRVILERAVEAMTAMKTTLDMMARVLGGHGK